MHSTGPRAGQTRTFRVTAVALAVLALSGCGVSAPNDQDNAGSEESVAFGHVHGLGINPADDRLYVASHMGVFKQTGDSFERVADRWQDTMAFTVTGADTFLASGHPDLRETEKPAHLGLIESTDAAESWKALSLEGEADFHALEPAVDRVYGYDATQGVLKVTRDRLQWRNLPQIGVIDLAVNPEDPAALLVTDDDAQLVGLGRDEKLTAVQGAPRLAFVDWPEPGLLVGVAPDGAVHRSRDGGASWESVNSVGSVPEALDITPGRWHVATERGLFSSVDDGQAWIPVSGQPGHR